MAWHIEVGDSVFCGVQQEHELGAVKAWEDKVLEELDGPEHIVIDMAPEPMELFEPIKHDNGPYAGVEHVWYPKAQRTPSLAWQQGSGEAHPSRQLCPPE